MRARRVATRHAAAWLLASAMAPGCQFVLSGDPTQCARDEDCPSALVCVDGLCVEDESGTGSTADSDASTSIDLACDTASECVPPAAPGWSGPVIAIATQREPAACPTSAPTIVTTGHAGLTAPEAECACDCKVTDEGCDVTLYAGLDCAPSLPWHVAEDACTAIPSGFLPFQGDAIFPAMFDGCAPMFEEAIPPAQWAEHVQLCEATEAVCEAGVCMPIPDPLTGAAMCIWREGDYACPDLAYPRKSVFHEDMSDERRCSACTCPERSSCRLEIYGDSGCADEPSFETVLDEDQCVPLADILGSPMATIGALVSRIEPSDGACAPSGGVAIGEAREVDAFTVCCR